MPHQVFDEAAQKLEFKGEKCEPAGSPDRYTKLNHEVEVSA